MTFSPSVRVVTNSSQESTSWPNERLSRPLTMPANLSQIHASSFKGTLASHTTPRERRCLFRCRSRQEPATGSGIWYLCFPFVRNLSAAILKLHFSRHTGLNPGCLVIHLISLLLVRSCNSKLLFMASFHSSNSLQQQHSLRFCTQTQLQFPHEHLQ